MNPNDNQSSITINLNLNDREAREKASQFIRDFNNQTITMKLNASGGSSGGVGGGSTGAAGTVHAASAVSPATGSSGRSAPSAHTVQHVPSNSSSVSAIRAAQQSSAFASAQADFTSSRQAYYDPRSGFAANQRDLNNVAGRRAKRAGSTDVIGEQLPLDLDPYYRPMSKLFNLQKNVNYSNEKMNDVLEGDDFLNKHSNKSSKNADRSEASGDYWNGRYEREKVVRDEKMDKKNAADQKRAEELHERGLRDKDNTVGRQQRDQATAWRLEDRDARDEYGKSIGAFIHKALPGLDPATYARGIMRGGMIVVGQSGQEYMAAATNERLTGRSDIMADARNQGGLVGGLIGMGLGALGGPWTASVGASAGSQVGGAIATYNAAGDARTIKMNQAMMSTGGLQAMIRNQGATTSMATVNDYAGQDDYGRGGTSSQEARVRFPNIQNAKNFSVQAGGTARDNHKLFMSTGMSSQEADQHYATEENVGSMMASNYAGLMAAGINPDQVVKGFATGYEPVIHHNRGRRQAKNADGTMRYERKWVTDAREAAVTLESTSTYGPDITEDSANSSSLIQSGGSRSTTRRGNRTGNSTTVKTGGIQRGHYENGAPIMEDYDFDTTTYDHKTVGRERYRVELDNLLNRGHGADAEPIMNTAIATIRQSLTKLGGDRAGMNGMNMTDMLRQFGPQATSLWQEAHTDPSKPLAINTTKLMDVTYDSQRLDRQGQFAATKARGSAHALLETTQSQIDNLARMPDGTSSLGYAQLGQQRRGFQSAAWQESDYLKYGGRLSEQNADMQVKAALPYESGLGMKMSLERMGTRSGYMTTLRDRYQAGMRDQKNFSVEMQQGTADEYNRLRVQQANDVSVLAESGADRIVALSAGRPASFSRYDSVGMAQAALWNVGADHVRSSGARDGRQLGAQQRWLNQFNTPSLDASYASQPKSLTAGADTLIEIRDLLKQSLQGGISGGMTLSGQRSGEARGRAAAALSLSSIDGSPPARTN